MVIVPGASDKAQRPLRTGARCAEEGSSLLYALAGLLVMSVMATGLASLGGRGALTETRTGLGNKARFLALSGVNYAKSLSWADFLALVGATSVLSLAGNDQVAISVTGPDAKGLYAIAARGAALPGEADEANALAYGTRSGVLSFEDDMAGFTSPAQSRSGVVTADTTAKRVDLGNKTIDTYATLWYSGNSALAGCRNGLCSMNKGFRAFFNFHFNVSGNLNDVGDGFTFAVLNGAQNDATRNGGKIGMGELMGYGGPGSTADGKGLRPPKFAVEFDVYRNGGTGDPDQTDSRADGAARDHMAYVFWGLEEADGTCSSAGYGYTCNQDDNRHSRARNNGRYQEAVGLTSGGDQPVNSVSSVTPDPQSYFAKSAEDWLRSGTHSLRMEVERPTTAVAGYYPYRIKTWVDCANCDDVLADFAKTSPTLDETFTLNATQHARFETFLFGWTMATGAAVEQVSLSDFKLAFK